MCAELFNVLLSACLRFLQMTDSAVTEAKIAFKQGRKTMPLFLLPRHTADIHVLLNSACEMYHPQPATPIPFFNMFNVITSACLLQVGAT